MLFFLFNQNGLFKNSTVVQEALLFLSFFLIVTATCVLSLRLRARQVPRAHVYSCAISQLPSQRHQLLPDKITSPFLALPAVLHTGSLMWVPSSSWIRVIGTVGSDWTLTRSYKASSSSSTMPKAKAKLSFLYFGYTKPSEPSSSIHFSSRHGKCGEDALNPSYSWATI